jgi:hypothetical protein
MEEIKEKLKKIENSLEDHTKILSNVDKTLALQAQQLEHHIHRTDIAEDNMVMLRHEFKPIQKHVELINGLAKIIALIGTIIGISYYGTQVVRLWFGL